MNLNKREAKREEKLLKTKRLMPTSSAKSESEKEVEKVEAEEEKAESVQDHQKQEAIRNEYLQKFNKEKALQAKPKSLKREAREEPTEDPEA